MAQDVLVGRHALVTGGARGLGAGMAQALAAAGAAVLIGDVLDDLAGETANGLGGHATHLDVSDEASWEAAVAATVEQLGGLDILVNNAGIEISGLIVDAEARRPPPDARHQRARHGARDQARAARDAPGGVAGNGSAIVNIASVAATIAFPGIAELLRHEVGDRPAHPCRRVRGRQARLRRSRRLRLPVAGARADRDGPEARGRHGRARPVREPEAAVEAPCSSRLRPAGWAKCRTWPTRSCSSPPTSALHHGSRAAGRRWMRWRSPSSPSAADGLAHRLPRQGRLARPERALPGRGRPLAVLRRCTRPQLPRRGRARARRHRHGAKVGILSSNNAVAFACVFGIARRGAVVPDQPP